MNHDDLVFTSELSQVNNDLARYLTRVLDLDPTVTEYTVPIDVVERSLGAHLVEVGQKLQARASKQAVIIEGEIEAPSPRVVP